MGHKKPEKSIKGEKVKKTDEVGKDWLFMNHRTSKGQKRQVLRCMTLTFTSSIIEPPTSKKIIENEVVLNTF